ncbi:C39 family peptidase [Moorella sp. E306M]|jgi:hypothetical protein|uniref:C39 family peptidase n=2 Tax=Neomoorella TaxID=44260 RepID=UPI0010FFC493|nr:C39 family peptidase [Moorella sp. E306M]GEA17260.1 hypothetical protein E306M_03940 [Moorella sp. E306M]
MRLYRNKIIILITFMVIFPFIAHADGPVTDPNYTQPLSERTKAQIERERQKEAITKRIMDIFYKEERGELPKGSYHKALEELRSEKYLPSPKGTTKDISIQGGSGKALVLDLVPQETNYYCGPATVYMMLDYLGVTNGPEDQPLTQSNLAKYMGTNTQGTDFNKIPVCLNDWWGRQWYVNKWAPTAQQVHDYTKLNVDLNYPVNYDAHTSSENGYLPGWEGKEVWHYLAGGGYITGGDGDPDEINYWDTYENNPEAYGNHWVKASVMSDVLVDRGMTY